MLQYHDPHHRVANGVAFPIETVGDVREGTPIWLFVTGKEWPAVAKVRLRRLKAGDVLTLEGNDATGWCEEGASQRSSTAQWAEARSIEELSTLFPYFFRIHGNA